MVVQVPLVDKNGMVVAHALVDNDKAPLVKNHVWRYCVPAENVRGYARAEHPSSTPQKRRWLYMHRLIAGIAWMGREVEVDYINLDKLDNRNENLRVVTRAQNKQNVGLQSNNTSGVRGVYWHQREKRWKTQIKINGHTQGCGTFVKKEDAIKAVTDARIRRMPYSPEARNAKSNQETNTV